ncbi:hypothetical protein yaldo0001_32650 [Yersinia aldovae ATCC 35236]|nr:hypothetical protein yaldo0001_32650 [Yersinia aldovae ATCC 35236]
MTFPMAHPGGLILNSEELKLHTETVLIERLATIHTVA